jgi:hypothetical protein
MSNLQIYLEFRRIRVEHEIQMPELHDKSNDIACVCVLKHVGIMKDMLVVKKLGFKNGPMWL